MQVKESVNHRTRNGCWTCRKRKKKCDESGTPCQNCKRLGLSCEKRVRLVWEDDERRIGMKRRGPPTLKHDNVECRESQAISSTSRSSASFQGYMKADQLDFDVENTCQVIYDTTSPKNSFAPARLVNYQQVSSYPRKLDQTESLFLSHYVQRFSRTYPTHSGPSNPFLSVLLPLAMKSEVVLDSLLALSGAQRWGPGWAWMYSESLRLKQRALEGCRSLLDVGDLLPAKPNVVPASGLNSRQMDPARGESLLLLLTSSILLLLYEKLSGEPNWKPHMNFISQVFDHWTQSLSKTPRLSEPIKFLRDVFVYNDLVRSTSLQTRPLSNFYLNATGRTDPSMHISTEDSTIAGKQDFRSGNDRYYFPNLIAKLSTGDETVREANIAAWNGRLDWLPSFALDDHSEDGSAVIITQSGDHKIISALYRTAASIYRLQVLPQNDVGVGKTALLPRLAAEAHSLLMSLRSGSVYENALLWPLGVAAKELTENQSAERQDVLARLQSLNDRFQMRHFSRVQDLLIKYWMMRDKGYTPDREIYSSETGLESILLG